MKKSLFTLLLIIICMIFFLTSCSTLEDLEKKLPQTEETAVPVNPDWDAAVTKALQTGILAHPDNITFQIYNVSIERIEYSNSGTLAVIWIGLIDPETAMVIPTEAGMAIAQRVKGEGILEEDWKISIQGDLEWNSALAKIPDSLVSQDIVSRYVAKEQKVSKGPPLTGYRLPYPAGRTMYLTGSIGHVFTYKSCPQTCLYAFDFADGTNFPVVAAKSGTVHMAVWKHPNNYKKYGNFIILEDTTTQPVTYQIYYHLAQDSIPAALTVKGARVEQGQLIGYADNTGPSTGSHLHFMVHTNPNSFWGTSVDIVFDEVTVNGGRPRTCAEADRFPQYGSQCTPKGKYTSDNREDKVPPTGSISAPAMYAEINQQYLTVTGAASDNRGVRAMQVYMTTNGSSWFPASQVITNTPFTTTADLCALKVPIGPVMIGLQVMDTSGNLSATLQDMRSLNMKFDCNPKPTAVPPTAVPPTAIPPTTILPTSAAPTPIPPDGGSPSGNCEPSADQIAVFTGSNYTGRCITLNQGGYPSLQDFNPESAAGQLGSVSLGSEVIIESIRLGSNVAVAAYPSADFVGERLPILTSIPQLSTQTGKSNWMQSFKIVMKTGLPAVPELIQPAVILGGAPNTKDEINLTWKVSSDAEEYASKVIGSNGYTKVLNWQTGYAWNLGQLPAGNYSWTVIARNLTGIAVKTENFVVVEPLEFPKTMPKDMPQVAQSTVLSLQWDAGKNSSNIQGFDIEYNRDNTEWIPWKQSLPAKQRQIFFLGELGHSYQFRIRAIDISGAAEEFFPLGSQPITIAADCVPDEYEKSSQADNNINGAIKLSENVPQIHNFCSYQDQDWIIVNAEKDNSYRITVKPVKGNVSGILEVYDPVSRQVLKTVKPEDYNQFIQLDWQAGDNGFYYIRITPYDQQIAGTDAAYEVKFEKLLPVTPLKLMVAIIALTMIAILAILMIQKRKEDMK